MVVLQGSRLRIRNLKYVTRLKREPLQLSPYITIMLK